MKFAYYGNFGRHNTESHIAEALEDFGHEVIRLSQNSFELPECDYRMFAKLTSHYVINASKEPTICWLFDLYRDFPGRTFKEPMFRADYVFTTDGGDQFDTIRQGIRKADKYEVKSKKTRDVIFVGSPYTKERVEMIKRTNATLIQNIRGRSLNELLGETKIVLGDSYPADNYWSNRVYEITGRGGFLIHPKTIGLPDYIPQFERGKEQEMVGHFLQNPKERERIRKIQFKNCPTYHDRVKELLEKIPNK